MCVCACVYVNNQPTISRALRCAMVSIFKQANNKLG